jgi:adenylylsulfate kinase-like enzyme
MKAVPITETADYKNKRNQIQAEINANKVNIDRSVFVKTPAEKEHLKHVKQLYKIANR